MYLFLYDDSHIFSHLIQMRGIHVFVFSTQILTNKTSLSMDQFGGIRIDSEPSQSTRKAYGGTSK